MVHTRVILIHIRCLGGPSPSDWLLLRLLFVLLSLEKSPKTLTVLYFCWFVSNRNMHDIVLHLLHRFWFHSHPPVVFPPGLLTGSLGQKEKQECSREKRK